MMDLPEHPGASYSFAFTGEVGDTGITKDVSVTFDEADWACSDPTAMAQKLTAFFRAVGWDSSVTIQ